MPENNAKAFPSILPADSESMKKQTIPANTKAQVTISRIVGLFLKKTRKLLNILCAVLINQLVLSLLLNTLWISVLYGSPYGPLLVTRLVQTGILVVVQVLVIQLLEKTLPRLKKALQD